MNREQYLKELENLKEVIKNAEKAKTELRGELPTHAKFLVKLVK